MFRSAAEFGELVRKKRVEKGLTQQDLADAVGTGKRFILDLEKGKETAHLGKALAVAREVGIDLVDARADRPHAEPSEPEPEDDDLSFIPKF